MPPISPAPPRRLPRQRRSQFTRDAILTAAERVLLDRGVDGLTTNRVAEKAGVSIGTFYQYFSNKRALVAALIERNLTQYAEAFRGILAGARSLPIDVGVHGMTMAIHAVFRGQTWVHLELYAELPGLGLSDLHDEVFAGMTDELAGFLAGHSTLAVADPHTTAYVLVHAVEGVLRAFAGRPGGRDVEGIARAIGALVLGHLTCGGAQSHAPSGQSSD